MSGKFFKTAVPIIRNASVGALSGGVAGYHVSDSLGSEAGFNSGWRTGLVTGAITGLTFSKLGRQTQLVGRTYAKGLGPKAGTAKTINALDMGYTKGRVIFRRVRGRIIAIKGKT